MEQAGSNTPSDKEMMADSVSDDPLSADFSCTLFVITREFDEDGLSDHAVVCGYSPRTGLSYIGTMGPGVS